MIKQLLLVAILLAGVCYPQSTGYTYKSQLGFNIADSLVSPYLCTVDSAGNIWVASSNFSSTTAINGLFKAGAGENSLQLVIKFSDTDSVRNVTGLTSIGNDIFVSARMSAPTGYTPAAYYPYSEIIYLPNGDASKKQIFKYPVSSGYGTWYTGLAATKDGYLYFGQSYLVTLGTVDGRKAQSTFGNTISFAYSTGSTLEPGGDLTYPNVMDLIRDVAVSPSGNYLDASSVIYTSRNSSADAGGSGKGGIAVWTGGTEANPNGYIAQRVSDLNSFLSFSTSVPYGITVNPVNGYLYVCGTDSSRKWVKGFHIAGAFAVQADELPGSTSADVKDVKGAPFIAPADAAFNSDGTVAYVADAGAKKVFKFSTAATGVAGNENSKLRSFELKQNYPNPFNPTTQIAYNIPNSGNVKVEVFNTYGQVVQVLQNGYTNEGTHVLSFNAAKFASGVYICKVTAGRNSQSIKMILMK